MSEELEKINDVNKMKALQLQIKAREIVLNQSLSDNKVLQQGSSRRFSRKRRALTKKRMHWEKNVTENWR